MGTARRLLVVASVLVLAVAGLGLWLRYGTACLRRENADLHRMETALRAAFPDARITERHNYCGADGDAELVARIDLRGRPGLREAAEQLRSAGWTRTVGFEHRSPDGRTTIRFFFDRDEPVVDRRALDAYMMPTGGHPPQD